MAWLHLVPQSEFVTKTEMDYLEGKLVIERGAQQLSLPPPPSDCIASLPNW